MSAQPVDIVAQRMRNQMLRGSRLNSAPDVVRTLGAVQAQDYGGAAWAVAERTRSVTRAQVDEALADGSIIRTHILRPTWHLVATEDLRWMLDLTGPRVRALTAFGERESGLDDDLIATSRRVIARALANGERLTRPELGAALRAAGIDVGDSLALSRLTLRAELDGVICSGGLRGRQQTYAFLDSRVTRAAPLDRDEALAALAARYFSSHGPASVRDFAWWSGLAARDAIVGARTASPPLESATLDNTAYWFVPPPGPIPRSGADAHLLPNFDEYTVAYADRSHVVDAADLRRLDTRDGSIFTNVVLASGRIVGSWRRMAGRAEVRVSVKTLRPIDDAGRSAIEGATRRYADFLGLSPSLEITEPPVSR